VSLLEVSVAAGASGPVLATSAPDDQPGANLIVTHVPSGPQVTLI
jgi:hypothetical protein